MVPKFCHLHVHSEMSFGDAIGSLQQISDEAARLEQSAFAITDHGHLFGLVDALTIENGVKVIPGAEIRVIDSQEEKHHKSSHLTIIAQSNKGLRNLLALLSRAHVDHFYYFGRTPVDELETLEECICLSGCQFGYVAKPLLNRGDARESRRRIAQLRAIFGDRFYLELQSHDDEAQIKWNSFLMEQEGAKVVTNDVHYPKQEDVLARQVAVGGRGSRSETTELPPTQLWLKSGERIFFDMRRQRIGRKDIERMMAQTVDIANSCNIQLKRNDYRVPAPIDAYERIERMCWNNLGKASRKYRQRLAEELAVVKAKGFAGFFWMVHEIIAWAKNKGMYISNRGSAVSSLVLYLLGITTLDPLQYNLPVFRFMSMTRDQPPDIDFDVERARRDELMQHIKDTYGEEHIAQLANIGRYKPYLLMNDIIRAWEKGYISDLGQYNPNIKPQLRKIAEGEEEWPTTKKFAQIKSIYDTLANQARYVSVHAGGILFSARPIWHSTHIYQTNSQYVAALDKYMAEKIGMMKLDILIVDTLDILRKAVPKKHRADLFTIQPNDPAVYRWISKHPYDLAGIFQLSDKGREAIQQIQPRTFDDLMIATTVIRPGSSGLKEYIKGGEVPDRFKKYLDRTRGVVLYQEQVMQLVMDVGFTPQEADRLMQLNKKPENQKKYKNEYKYLRAKWIQGCSIKGISIEKAATMWNYLIRYGFNASHSAGYSYLTYLTAWAKSKYYLRFMCALLNYEKSEERERQIVRELIRSGVKLLPPHINKSKVNHYVAKGKAIRVGLGSIKFVGNAARIIVKHQPYDKKSWEQFQTQNRRVVNKRVVDALKEAGALKGIV